MFFQGLDVFENFYNSTLTFFGAFSTPEDTLHISHAQTQIVSDGVAMVRKFLAGR
jgi:hypothetical protein